VGYSLITLVTMRIAALQGAFRLALLCPISTQTCKPPDLDITSSFHIKGHHRSRNPLQAEIAVAKSYHCSHILYNLLCVSQQPCGLSSRTKLQLVTICRGKDVPLGLISQSRLLRLTVRRRGQIHRALVQTKTSQHPPDPRQLKAKHFRPKRELQHQPPRV